MPGDDRPICEVRADLFQIFLIVSDHPLPKKPETAVSNEDQGRKGLEGANPEEVEGAKRRAGAWTRTTRGATQARKRRKVNIFDNQRWVAEGRIMNRLCSLWYAAIS